MTSYCRRFWCLALALAIMITLFPALTGRPAAAESELWGKTTADNVNVRYSAGKNGKIMFKIPVKNTVCKILSKSTVDGKTWYYIETPNPDHPTHIAYCYVVETVFVPLTDEEAMLYEQTNSISGVIPTADPVSGYTPAPENTALTNVDTAAPDGAIGYITNGSGVNLREGPGRKYHSMGTLNRNDQVTILTYPSVISEDTWYKVRATIDGTAQEGYVMATYVRYDANSGAPVITPTPAPVTSDPNANPTDAQNGVLGYVMTIKGGVKVRATTGGTVLTTIGKYETYPYVLDPFWKNGYKWYFIQVDATTKGYVRGDCVKETTAPTPTPVQANTPTPAPTEQTVTAAPVVTPTATTVPDDQPAGYVKTTTSGVNLRKKAGYTDVLGQIGKGKVLPYYGTPVTVKKVTWYKVKDSKLGYGYIHGNFVTVCNADGSAIVTPAPVTPEPTQATVVTPEPTGTSNTGNNNGTAVTPAPSGQEATYTTLKLGSSGNAVKNLITELKNQGYYTGAIGTKYTSAVVSAVRKFQQANDLTADGVAGAATQHKLFGTVPVGAGDNSNLDMEIYPAEKIDWYTGGINELWARGSNYKVYDVKTGIVWWAHRWAGGLHVDAEPLTAADTARLCKCYGVTTAQEIADKDLWQRRPILVTIGTRTFAASLYGVPHNYPDGDTIPDNQFKGQVCIHFTNSKVHGSRKVDSGHEEAIEYAWLNAPNGHK